MLLTLCEAATHELLAFEWPTSLPVLSLGHFVLQIFEALKSPHTPHPRGRTRFIDFAFIGEGEEYKQDI